MKGLFQRNNVWWIRYSSEGKQYRESLGTSDESHAIILARDILESPARMDARAWQSELASYLAERKAAQKLSENACRARGAVLRMFGQSMEITHPSQVTPAMGERWYRALKKGNLPHRAPIEETTAQTYVRWLATFLSYLVEKRKLLRNPIPLASVEFDRAKKALRKTFCTKEQVRAIIQAAPSQTLRFALYCGFHAGFRRGEIAEARPEWFDLQRGVIHIQRSATWEPKDRDDRQIPLTQEFSDFLKQSYGLPAPFMIPGRPRSKPQRSLYRYDIRRPFTELMVKLGLRWVTPHTSRRTFASLKVSDGVSLYKVAVWLGDLEKVVQDHYGHLLPTDPDIERGL